MAETFTANRMRIALDGNDPMTPAGMSDAVTGRHPELWAGADTVVQFALFCGSDLVDTSTITTVYFELDEHQSTTDSHLAQDSIAGGSLDATLATTEWTAGTGQHGSFSLSSSETDACAPAILAERTRTCWASVWADLTDGSKVTFGAFPVVAHRANIT